MIKYSTTVFLVLRCLFDGGDLEYLKRFHSGHGARQTNDDMKHH